MNFQEFHYFIVAVEEMNFTRAAKRLFLSQQSLSNHIARLEEYYGLQLFDRNPPLTLTPAGECLYGYAQSLVDTEKQARQMLCDIKDFRNSDLRIGISHYRGNVMLPYILPAFHRQYPDIHLHLMEGKLARITEALYKGKVDLIFGYESNDTENIRSQILYEEKSIIAVPDAIFKGCFSQEEQEQMEKKHVLSLDCFADCPFLIMGNNTWMRGVFDRYCAETGIRFQIVLETVSITTMISLCVAGMGVIICPNIYLTERELNREKLRSLHLFELDYPMANKRGAINSLKCKYQTEAAKALVRMARELFQTWENSTDRLF